MTGSRDGGLRPTSLKEFTHSTFHLFLPHDSVSYSSLSGVGFESGVRQLDGRPCMTTCSLGVRINTSTSS